MDRRTFCLSGLTTSMLAYINPFNLIPSRPMRPTHMRCGDCDSPWWQVVCTDYHVPHIVPWVREVDTEEGWVDVYVREWGNEKDKGIVLWPQDYIINHEPALLLARCFRKDMMLVPLEETGTLPTLEPTTGITPWDNHTEKVMRPIGYDSWWSPSEECYRMGWHPDDAVSVYNTIKC